MALLILLITSISLIVFLINYYKRSVAIYVPDRRFKSGRRHSHNQRLPEEEIENNRRVYGRLLKIFSVVWIVALFWNACSSDNDKKVIKASLFVKGDSLFVNANEERIDTGRFFLYQIYRPITERDIDELKISETDKNIKKAYLDKNNQPVLEPLLYIRGRDFYSHKNTFIGEFIEYDTIESYGKNDYWAKIKPSSFYKLHKVSHRNVKSYDKNKYHLVTDEFWVSLSDVSKVNNDSLVK